MRLIDADELLERMKRIHKFYREHNDADARKVEVKEINEWKGRKKNEKE